jgi:hypothetical protein
LWRYARYSAPVYSFLKILAFPWLKMAPPKG